MVETSQSPLAVLEAECRALLSPLLPPETALSFERPRAPEFGDLSCNVAMRLARPLGRNPFELAQEISAGLNLDNAELVGEARAARPGFINFHLNHDRFSPLVIEAIRTAGSGYGRARDVVAPPVGI